MTLAFDQSITQHLTRIREFVERNKLNEALSELQRYSDFRNEISLLRRRLHAHNDNIRLGFPWEQSQYEEAKIARDILSLTEQIWDTKFNPPSKLDTDTIRIELALQANFKDYSLEMREKIMEALFTNLELGAREIKLVMPREGSILLPIDLPRNRKKLLRKLLKRGALLSFGIRDYRTVFEKKGKSLKLYGDPPYQLAQAGLQSVNLRKANLRGADLYKADLRGANLSQADLSSANLLLAKMEEVRLTNATLFETYLHGAILTEANLTHANLHSVNLSNARLVRVNFEDATLSRVNLQSASLAGSRLVRTILDGVDVVGVDLSSVDLSRANIRRIIASASQSKFLSGLYPHQVDYTPTPRLITLSFELRLDSNHAESEIEFHKARNLIEFELRNSKVKQVKPKPGSRGLLYQIETLAKDLPQFLRRISRRTDFQVIWIEFLRGEDLSRIDLFETNLSGVTLREVNLSYAKFRFCNLQKAILQGANLFKANLQNTDLSGADLTAANLTQASLNKVTISRSTVISVKQLLSCQSIKGIRGLSKEMIQELRQNGVNLDQD